MKFVMSYSCGKDSTLSLHKMLEQGHEAVCLLIMMNENVERSYFHGADRNMLHRYSKALNIPTVLCPSDGTNYDEVFEKGLERAVAMGAEGVCFGDIDIEQNRQWDEARCANTGLVPFFPLWKSGREENVYEFIRLGYKCLIKCVNKKLLPLSLLGTYLDMNAVSVMKSAGIDICGENGEYHTLTVNGPIFCQSLDFKIGDIMEFGDYAVVDVW